MGGQGEGQPAWPLAAGTALGKYQVVRLVGEGGMGAVYEGLHVEIGKRVAIKAMNPVLAAIPEARARFVREAQLTSRVRHPHIVDVTDIGSEGPQPFLVMEYLEGEDLAHQIQRRGPLPIEEVADIGLPVLAAVAAAHDEGIVHRDLKPLNIFLSAMRDGTIRPTVLDFGISKAPPHLETDPITTAGGLLGSPSYFAPEQVSDPKAASPASDQYAVGVILYECVTGRLPYQGTSLAAIFQAILGGEYPPVQTQRLDLPQGLAAIIARAMAIEPAARFPGVREMGRALLPFASEKGRLLWADHFLAERPVGATAERPRAPVPVTDQTPGPAAAPRSVTVSLAGDRGPSSVATGEPDAPLAIPRRKLAPWVMGGVALAAVILLAAVGSRGGAGHRAATPPPAKVAPAPPAPSTPATASVPAVSTSARHDAKGESDDERRAGEARRGRSGRALRFGANRAPLIE